MFMGEFSQSYRCSPKQKTVRTPVTVRTPKEEAHTQSDNVRLLPIHLSITIMPTTSL
uniref:Uncharacterized protein n=1 Tax=Helianthus annuus TaxID=4232 RepID=A0A251US11_HELAN